MPPRRGACGLRKELCRSDPAAQAPDGDQPEGSMVVITLNLSVPDVAGFDAALADARKQGLVESRSWPDPRLRLT